MCPILPMVLFLFLACLLPHLLASSCPVDIHHCFSCLGIITVTQHQKVTWPWGTWIFRRLTSMVFSSLLPCSTNQRCVTSGHRQPFLILFLFIVSDTPNISRCQRTRGRTPCCAIVYGVHPVFFFRLLVSLTFCLSTIESSTNIQGTWLAFQGPRG